MTPSSFIACPLYSLYLFLPRFKQNKYKHNIQILHLACIFFIKIQAK